MAIDRLCRLAGVSRAGYYRSFQESRPRQHDTMVRDAVQRTALAGGACGGYTARLDAHGIAASMSRVGNPYDNAKAESFMKTLKAEEADARLYRTLREAEQCIGTFIEEIYNKQRLHSALGYRPPVEFETLHRLGLAPGVAGAARDRELRAAHAPSLTEPANRPINNRRANLSVI